ncbi:S23 ribosomal protein [Sphaerospermopsis reniformis]|uniref:S23 ribosomal protein n=1 Tax=Sphaerospermopsis reniformis TaxID=531300 RepID=A0A480A6X0_9CYAN|nr:four helix bundle protein [Sphaerospermopsis reniformis]GCL40272.1 S23 ribosomal protein [Sphaerospermopsis reniformis]
MGRPDFEKLQVDRLSEKLANEIWRIVMQWDSFSKDTVGRQMVRAADSIGANIAEGRGRYNLQDNKRFIRIARGSLNETIHWMRLAYVRKLLTIEHVNILKPLIDELSPKLNAYLNSLGKTKDHN